MQKDSFTEKLLNEFVFLDCRLGSHPKVRTSLFWRDGDRLVLTERLPTSHTIEPHRELGFTPDTSLIGLVFGKKQYVLLENDEGRIIQPTRFERVSALNTTVFVVPNRTSVLALPLLDGSNPVGVLSFDVLHGQRVDERHIGTAQLLAAILTYSQMYLNSRIVTPASVAIGKALRKVREEIGISQTDLATRISQTRIAISRWENGAQPPSKNLLYEWCRALGLFSSSKGTLVTVVDITPKLLNLLKNDPTQLHNLTPDKFEQFIADRLDRMGFEVTLTGATSHRDGGIDIIAVPKIRTMGTFLLAAQVKHHSGNQKTGRDAVDRLLAWKDSPFRLGLLVTNTQFTRDAQWVAAQISNKYFLRLRGFNDLKRWIEGNYWSEEDWREIPDEVNLAPGVTIRIPKPRVEGSLNIWPLTRLDINNLQ